MIHFLQIDKEQAELARANFSILRKEGQAILDLVGTLSSLNPPFFSSVGVVYKNWC